ncbi:unnamed protein product [Heligmosomoides polygyrus]|uniref:Ovule protein n=1 Tax=Heligmosomoides polygyrus TaxID=6339 RepID=A0A3P8EXD4_HELPZ|nr:unnamed protein product [Heligmosomoides polygyrus]
MDYFDATGTEENWNSRDEKKIYSELQIDSSLVMKSGFSMITGNVPDSDPTSTNHVPNPSATVPGEEVDVPNTSATV